LNWKYKKGSWRLHTNPVISIWSWALQHLEDVFFFQDVGEINRIQVPFTIGIQTNDMKFHLFTLMGFDDHRTGVPLALIITSRQLV
jgi:hypothetical protein